MSRNLFPLRYATGSKNLGSLLEGLSSLSLLLTLGSVGTLDVHAANDDQSLYLLSVVSVLSVESNTDGTEGTETRRGGAISGTSAHCSRSLVATNRGEWRRRG
jgi:hypothetical protein